MKELLSKLMLGGGTVRLFFQVLPISALAGTVYAAWKAVTLTRRGLSIPWGTELCRTLFVCYLTGLANLVLVPANLWTAIWFRLLHGYAGVELRWSPGGVNLAPSILKYLHSERTPGRWVREMLIGNTLMFLPLGVFLHLVFRDMTTRTALLLAALVPLCVEVLQPLMGRSFDVDDLLGNFAGITLGWFLALGAARLFDRGHTPS